MSAQMTVISLPEAAQRLGIAPEALTRLVQSDKIKVRTVRTHAGQLMLDEGDVQRMAKAKALRDRIWERVAKFEGETVSTQEARETFGIHESTLYRCIENGYIRAGRGSKGGRGKKRELNKADVAYVSELAKRGRGRGHRLFGPDTIPPHFVFSGAD
jgi:predicted site-specific integrase-resolvase